MRKLIILGGGGFAREVYSYFVAMAADSKEPVVFKGYLDVGPDGTNPFPSGEFLGHERDHRTQQDEYFVLGMADNERRATILSDYQEMLARGINIVHPSASVDPSAELGQGNVIGPFCHIGANVKLGAHNVLNYGCSVGHDSNIGDNNVFASDVQVAGYVKMGNNNFLGLSAGIIPRVEIGDYNKVQAGTLVTDAIVNRSFCYRRDVNKVAKIFGQTAAIGHADGN